MCVEDLVCCGGKCTASLPSGPMWKTRYKDNVYIACRADKDCETDGEYAYHLCFEGQYTALAPKVLCVIAFNCISDL